MWLYLDDKRLPTTKFKRQYSKSEELFTFTNTLTFIECLQTYQKTITGVSLDYNLDYDFQGIENFYVDRSGRKYLTGKDTLEYILRFKFKGGYLRNLKTIRLHSGNEQFCLDMAALVYKYTTTDPIIVILDPFTASGYDQMSKYPLY